MKVKDLTNSNLAKSIHDASDDAVIGFVRHCGVRIVAGAPVCAKERLMDVVAEFEQASAIANCRVCYFCAESRLETALRSSAQHSMALLGAQPSWLPLQWPAIFQRHASLRAQLKRASNKAVRVSEWPVERASREPALLNCLRWVRAHGRRFYNFNGLDAFKAKFQPEGWEPIFAISNEARFSPLTLYAIASAFTQGSPLRATSHAILKALQTEIDWMTEKLRRN